MGVYFASLRNGASASVLKDKVNADLLLTYSTVIPTNHAGPIVVGAPRFARTGYQGLYQDPVRKSVSKD
jgi:hypothetical protein